ncbi:MAG: CBM21 domain-containing protein [Oscillospiraceae bacterium]|jgi:hypothetical protein|nr:CBM21 domain-containing protein [Oscillospiraceae bacterium]
MTKTTNKRRITAIAIVLTLILSMFAMMPTASAVTNEVSLIYAEALHRNAGGGYYLRGYVEVENLALNKTVTIHYSNDDITWYEVDATYTAPTYGNKEAWYFETAPYDPGYRGTGNYYFAIEYVVNGVTYWDNNGGNDYYANSGGYGSQGTPVVFGTGKVFVRDAYFAARENDDNRLVAQIYVKNIAYNKVVNVRYSTDDWATYTDVPAAYNLSNYASDAELWIADVDIPSYLDEISFAVSYTVNGETYWDNNFGQNYNFVI